MAIDCINPGRTLESMLHTSRLCRFYDIILLTDTRRWNPDIMRPKVEGLRVIHHEERNGHRIDYELAVHQEPIKHLSSEYLLFTEWDSAVINPEAWDETFLLYDYIGAPWSCHHDPGWPPCDLTNNVGNGGFSLKSHRWCSRVAELSKSFGDLESQKISDSWACRTVRAELIESGIRFAPDHIAARFSCENRIYSGQFGFHGRSTVAMNGWGGSFFSRIATGKL